MTHIHIQIQDYITQMDNKNQIINLNISFISLLNNI